MEPAINMAPELFDQRGHIVAHGEGLFTHADIDRDLGDQSPCYTLPQPLVIPIEGE